MCYTIKNNRIQNANREAAVDMSMRKQKGETAEMKFIGGILNKYITVYLSVPALRMARSLALGKGIRVNAGSLCLCFLLLN
ncbi:hypothetical protein DWB64_03300 [Fusibacter sp. A1]|nr:hypothetical protein DWB64_03300 [Fusibacter sp. A1]